MIDTTTTKWSIKEKWGAAVTGGHAGFHAVPDVLVRGQSRLGLSNTEMVVILNLLMHWWTAESLPHPRPSVIAKRMGVSTRTVERTIESLEKKGLIQRLPPEESESGLTIRRFNMDGLVRAVQDLSDELKTAA